jgi:hypothetical protein
VLKAQVRALAVVACSLDSFMIPPCGVIKTILVST